MVHQKTKEGLKSAMIMCGVLCVMTIGTTKMLMLFVDSLVFNHMVCNVFFNNNYYVILLLARMQEPLRFLEHILVKVLDRFSLTESAVMELSHQCWNATHQRVG